MVSAGSSGPCGVGEGDAAQLWMEMGPGSIWDVPPPSASPPGNVLVSILSISNSPWTFSLRSQVLPAEPSLESMTLPTACDNLASAPRPPEPVFPSPLPASAVDLRGNQKPLGTHGWYLASVLLLAIK